MKREFAFLCMAVFIVSASIPGTGRCGYRMSSDWRSDSHRFWYIIEVVSGAPPPFRDLHVETGDADPSNYLLAKAPEGWQMSIVTKNDGSGDAWINFYGDMPCTAADIRVEYSGDFDPKRYSVWLLTDDGDPDPDTGAIPGENGDDAYGAWPPCENLDVKVGVHVIPMRTGPASGTFRPSPHVPISSQPVPPMMLTSSPCSMISASTRRSSTALTGPAPIAASSPLAVTPISGLSSGLPEVCRQIFCWII
jgi:hypothetical protein